MRRKSKSAHFSSLRAASVMSCLRRPSRRGSAASSSQGTPYASGLRSMRTNRYVYDSHAHASFTLLTVPARIRQRQLSVQMKVHDSHAHASFTLLTVPARTHCLC